MHFRIVGTIRSARTIATGSSVRIRNHLVRKFGAGPPASRCIENGEYEADLIVGKIYRIVEPKRNDRPSDVRVVDGSGEDYLYPREWFVAVDLPLKARKALVAVH
jgi:hypothetical protein